jgi:oligopeptidase B
MLSPMAVLLGVLPLTTAAAAADAPEPPVAQARPHQLEAHGQVRVDPYYWLRERENPEVIAYLAAENAYLDQVLAHTEALQEKLFEEITGRIKEDDSSVPYLDDGYYYYRRYEEGGEYPIYCRKEGSLEAPEEILVDGNAWAEGHGFFSLAPPRVSSGRDILAFAIDTVGRRFYTLRFKNLTTGEALADVIPDVTGNVAWANDNRTVFYTKQDPQTLRWYRVYRHVLGTDPGRDDLVYEEKDETFSTGVFKTKSRRYVMRASQQTLSTEYAFLDAAKPDGEFTVVLPREKDHEYSVDHLGHSFYIRTNWKAKNFRLMKTPVEATKKESWIEVVPHRADVLLEGFELFDDYLVTVERGEALNQIRVRPWEGAGAHAIEFPEPVYMADLGVNREMDTHVLRYTYESMTTPESTYDYDMSTGERTLLKREEVVGGHDPSDYVTERLWATARDGVRVPLSIVYSRDFERDGTHPLLLYAYGSYGATIDPGFDSARLSLLQRGFAFAIAHVRGGQALGRQWYEDGKLLKKKNTFTDFIDCARHLVEQGYTSRDRLFAAGGSAGGLLMGAVANMAPELFEGVIAYVPWVDVVTTMLDSDIPLTTAEYDEWGDPHQREYYDYMLSYSPYDQVEAKDYPNLLVTTGLHDSQVQYWEPAKWVAKLRATKTDDNLVLLKTNMEAGHGGPSGRFARHRQTALAYAFMLDLVGIEK